MKKLTVLLPDEHGLSHEVIAALVAVALEFRVEQVAEASPAKRTRAPRVRGKSGPDAIMAHYAPELGFDTHEAARWLEAEGHSASSASACLSKLVKQGRVARSANGRFRFISKVADPVITHEAE